MTLNISELQYLPNISRYGHNYYKMAQTINECDILYEECCDCWGITEKSLGTLIEGKYVVKFYLSPYEGKNADPLSDEFCLDNLTQEDKW